MRKRKAQSILEYVIVLTVIVIAIAIGANSMIKPAINGTMNSTGNTITNSTSMLPGN